jgi:hypothetical protein
MIEQPQRFALLLGSVVTSVAVMGAIDPGSVQQVVVSVLLATSLLLAFRIARVTRRLMLIAIAIAITGVAVSVLEAVSGAVGDGEARVMNALLVSLGPPAVALGVIRNLRAHREVRVEAVMGVLSLYMLLGLLFAFEALVGQIYLVTVVSLIVSNLGRRSGSR